MVLSRTIPGIRDDDAVCVPVKAGDIACFWSLTPHMTGPNETDDVRKADIVQFAPDGWNNQVRTCATLPTLSSLPILLCTNHVISFAKICAFRSGTNVALVGVALPRATQDRLQLMKGDSTIFCATVKAWRHHL